MRISGVWRDKAVMKLCRDDVQWCIHVYLYIHIQRERGRERDLCMGFKVCET